MDSGVFARVGLFRASNPCLYCGGSSGLMAAKSAHLPELRFWVNYSKKRLDELRACFLASRLKEQNIYEPLEI
jgi:hypothetical protein